ncbi:MAG: right-handed parallel beta-helix repeat-containing protein [Candidatus Delongbacteria bacterium]|nr:right-handed parallel beta-helix repeat-containing protein [Candidatus Delongbacteria bacterium]
MYRYFILFILAYISFVSSQTIINGGDINTTKWTTSGSPYQVYGDIEIPYGERLTIEPGVQVIFFGHFWINVQGSVIAKGKADDMIIFTSCDEQTKWFGIRFIYTPTSSPSSLIEFCHLSNSKAIQEELPSDPDSANKRHGGAIYLRQFSKVTIANCIIEDNIAATGGGIGLREASPMIKDNIIRNNISQGPSSGWGGGISITLDSDPVVKGNLIENNICIGDNNYAGGSGVYLDFGSDAVILNNIIRFNSIVFSKSVLDKAYDGAAFYIHSSSPQIIGNLIYGNSNDIEDGGGFWMYRCDSKIINNTIKSNYATNGGGFYLRESNPEFHNNIIRYNEVTGTGNQFYLNDNGCDPNFYNNNIQGGLAGFGGAGSGIYFTGAWVNNSDEDPKYEGGSKEYSYQLTSLSPCIDNGTTTIPDFEFPLEDLNGNIRIWSNTKGNVDMGAYEYNSQPAVMQTPVNISTSVTAGSVNIVWDAVPNSLYYRVFSSDDNVNFEEDFSGTFNENTWTVSVVSSKKFYYIVAVN